MAPWCRGGVDAAVCRSLGAVERRKRGGAVLCSASGSTAARLGVLGWRRGGDEDQGGRRGIYKAAATLGVRARGWEPGGIPGGRFGR